MVAFFFAFFFVAAVVAADVAAVRRGRVALALARLDDVRAALVSIAAQHKQLGADARRETEAALLIERQRLAAALAPVGAALDDVVRDAPADHVLTPGLHLVARQLSGAVATLSK